MTALRMLTAFKEIIERYQDGGATKLIPLAEELGLKVFLTEDFRPNESGSLKKEGETFAIYVNSSHPPTRRRFTIAHEIAHYILHRDKLGLEHVDGVRQPSALHRKEEGVKTPEEKAMEIEANTLAAEILMPTEPFRNAWKTATSVEEVARQFNVSVSAASIRAEKLLGEVMM